MMNEKKIAASRISAFLLLQIAVFLYQTCFAQNFKLFGATPSALIAAAVVTGMFGGMRMGFSFGLFLGLLCDATAGFLFGYYGLMLMLTGLAAGILVELLLWRSFLAALIIQAGSYLTLLLANLCMQLVVVGKTDRIVFMSITYLKEMVFSCFLLIPVYIAGKHIYQRYYAED